MSNSYRIRTQVGVDKQINIQLDQDFDQLEILSLKIRQEEAYPRFCADYGVVAGRVIVNDGFGVPNVKISIFVPLDQVDLQNPIISTLYPYRDVTDVNDDGYRYNLLPYDKQHGGHTPTGTFPSKQDIITNPALIEIYDKYYKYTVKTNASGDFLIMGVPLGEQKLVMDCDLSDIGPFSLAPQDLVDIGLATPEEIDGNKFPSSNNLDLLPQIINQVKTIQVQPFWGDPEICQIRITREDFNLLDSGVKIIPSAIFMGSLFSNVDEQSLSKRCRPKNGIGKLCNLTSGPGEIVAVRQTIFNDENGYPILEQAELPNGGKVIDVDGTFVFNVPMNMDYVTTNEFGEQIISLDPSVGIPTSGKYRFKIKYDQPPTFQKREIRRGYYLVPNIKEYGWSVSQTDPAYNISTNSTEYKKFQSSYYFGLDWSGYTNGFTITNNEFIDRMTEMVNCQDTFYQLKYRKVYTTAALIDNFKSGDFVNRFVAIKDITDETCEGTINKFPSTDANYKFDFIFFVANILLTILGPILLVLIVQLHVLSLLLTFIREFFIVVLLPVLKLVYRLCNWANKIGFKVKCKKPPSPSEIRKRFPDLKKLKIPMLTYPDCQACDCSSDDILGGGGFDDTSCNADLNIAENWTQPYNAGPNGESIEFDKIQYMFAGWGWDEVEPRGHPYEQRIPKAEMGGNSYRNWYYYVNSLPPWETINMFSLKGNYFNHPTVGATSGGISRIGVTFNPDFNVGKQHYDNAIALIVDEQCFTSLSGQTLLTFQNPNLSKDINAANVISGVTYTNIDIEVNYANFSNTNLQNSSVNYRIGGNAPLQTTDSKYFFPSDLEYFQVITGMSYNQFVSLNVTNSSSGGINFLCFNVTFDLLPDPNINVNAQNYQTLNEHTIEYTDCFGVQQIESLVPGQYSRCVRTQQGQQPQITNQWTDPANHTQPGSATPISPQILFTTNCSNQPTPPPQNVYVLSDSLYKRLSKQFTLYWDPQGFQTGAPFSAPNLSDYLSYYKGEQLYIIFMVRGVDPYSGKHKVKYDLSRLFGYDTSFNPNTITVQGNYYLNIPIQAGGRCVRHDQLVTNSDTQLDGNNSNATLKLYFDSYLFQPGINWNSYNSDLHLYYSSLDGTQIDKFQAPGYFNNQFSLGPTLSITDVDQTTTSLKLEVKVQGTNAYIQEEYIEGGSYIRYGPSGVNSFPGNIKPTVYFGPSYINGSYSTSTPPPNRPILQMTDQFKLVMRTDRLPTGTDLDTLGTNTFSFQCSTSLGFYFISESGATNVILGDLVPDPPLDDLNDDIVTGNTTQKILESLTCQGLVDLDCYVGYGSNLIIKPSTDPCNTNTNRNLPVIKDGCYVLLNEPFGSLFGRNNDFTILSEWKLRFRTTLALCRGVVSQSFNNSWVNGGLFAFPFSSNVFFDSNNKPFVRRVGPNVQGQSVEYSFCGLQLAFEEQSNNFYYRSSPYSLTSGFIGASYSPNFYRRQSNSKYLKYPTTMVDLGPQFFWTKDVYYSNDYYGYNMDNLDPTSYGPTENLTSVFALSRILNTNEFFSAGVVRGLFSRSNLRVDGDYAQMLQINSQYGINPFNAENYPDDGTTSSSIYFGLTPSNFIGLRPKPVFGIFYSGETTDRDLISPKRIDYTLTGSVVDFVADSLPVVNQTVPFYPWKNNGFLNIANNGVFSIFGSESNSWITDKTTFSAFTYQRLDRFYFPFFVGGNQQVQNSLGYIYQTDPTGLNFPSVVPGTTNLETLTSGPFYFYFGIKNGATAIDKFRQKYIPN